MFWVIGCYILYIGYTSKAKLMHCCVYISKTRQTVNFSLALLEAWKQKIVVQILNKLYTESEHRDNIRTPPLQQNPSLSLHSFNRLLECICAITDKNETLVGFHLAYSFMQCWNMHLWIKTQVKPHIQTKCLCLETQTKASIKCS